MTLASEMRAGEANESCDRHQLRRAPDLRRVPRAHEGPAEVLVDVSAAVLTNLAKGQASGRHYSRDATFPFVPGSDGGGRTSEGRRVYFAFPRAPFGSMAERSVVRRAYTVDVPEALDDVTAAALGNPGMSSWAALAERARFQRGESVLICGATGISGRLAVPIAKWLGARRIVAMAERAGARVAARGRGRRDHHPVGGPGVVGQGHPRGGRA